MRHDFGVVRPGVTLTHSFTLTNTTTQTWKLTSIEKPSCACSLVSATGDVFATGESQSFEFKYQVSDKPNDDSQTVKVHLKTPGETTVALNVSAKVRHPMTLVPGELSFGQVAQGGKETLTLRIENYSDADWSGGLVPNLPPWVQLSQLEKRADVPAGSLREVWDATLTLDTTGKPVGSLQEVASIASKDGKQRGNLPIQAHIVDDVTVAPSVLNFGKVDPVEGGRAKMIVRVKGRRGNTFSPLQVEVTGASGDKVASDWT